MRVGDKVKGFDFKDGTDGVEFYSAKEFYTGKEGVVKYIRNRYFAIQFEDDYWEYPISLAHLAQIEWQPKQGDIIEVSAEPDITFIERRFLCMDKGKYVYMKRKFRVVADSYAGYEVQIWRWYFPFWVQAGFVNTNSTIDKAIEYIEKYDKVYYQTNKL